MSVRKPVAASRNSSGDCASPSRCQLSSGNFASITSEGALLGMKTSASGRLPFESVAWKA